ncbi:MAG: polysaccharide biosynthesis C-terminal domain-containing protein [Candidatus Krumholzibacteriia bacterium]
MFLARAVVTLAGKAVMLGIGFGLSILTARLLGAEGKGQLSIALLPATVFVMLGGLGLENSNQFLRAREKTPLASLLGNSSLVATLMSVVLGLLFWATWPWLRAGLGGVDPRYIVLAMAILPFGLMLNYTQGLLLVEGRVPLFNAVKLVQPAGFFVLLVVLALSNRVVVGSATVVFVASFALACMVAMGCLTRIAGGWTWDAATLRRSLGYGGRSYVGNIFHYLNLRLDIYLLNLFLLPREVGLYVVAVSVAQVLSYLPQTFGMLLFPRTMKSAQQEGERFTARLVRMNLWIMLVGGAGLALVTPWLVPAVYGAEFHDSLPALYVLLPAIIAMGYSVILGGFFFGRGRPLLVSISSGIALVTNIALNVILIPRLGIVGAAAASFLSYGSQALVLAVAFLRATHLPVSSLVLQPAQDRKFAAELVRDVRERLHLVRRPRCAAA